MLNRIPQSLNQPEARRPDPLMGVASREFFWAHAGQHQPKKTDLARLLSWAGLSFLLSACDQDKAFYIGHTAVLLIALVLAIKIALMKDRD